MPTFAEVLQRFDRKERNWLARDALGNPSLGGDFRAKLEKALSDSGVNVSIPQGAFWALDFHWNWLVGAVAELECAGGTHALDGAVAQNQEDVDLLVAFENTAILVEAKATGAWSNKQTRSKLKRLRHLKQVAMRLGDRFGITLHFVLTSPARPEHFSSELEWGTRDGKYAWMPLHPPEVSHFLRVEFPRGGKFWAVEEVRRPKTVQG